MLKSQDLVTVCLASFSVLNILRVLYILICFILDCEGKRKPILVLAMVGKKKHWDQKWKRKRSHHMLITKLN